MKYSIINNKKNYTTFVVLLALCMALSAGCSKKADALDAYRISMEEIFTRIADIEDNMEAIDPDSLEAPEQLLEQIRLMKDAVHDIEVQDTPDEFMAVKELAKGASENLEQAYTMYSGYLNHENFDRPVLDAAFKYYERAGMRLNLMLDVLHGEEPEGENITVTYDTPDTGNDTGQAGDLADTDNEQ